MHQVDLASFNPSALVMDSTSQCNVRGASAGVLISMGMSSMELRPMELRNRLVRTDQHQVLLAKNFVFGHIK